ncbi:multicopper oxidase domain-containing protein [Paenibacillus sp. GYB004]|uniref:multicopper oxidase family protein n=1 Tax=Paenibacillus sp. GYB004 TaxID=2994393 RepID=UPI002F961BAF
MFINGWGYNGSIPGPTIRVLTGDYVNIRVINRLPEPTSVHWHGLDVPNRMDGVPDVEPSPKIDPGTYFDYRFRIINQSGTHMYHTHFQTVKQEMMGMGGALIIEEAVEREAKHQRDYFIMLQEFHVKGLGKGDIKAGTFEIDPLNDMFNFFTMNGRCFPYTTPLPVTFGHNVKIRLGNIGMNAHPIHIHGHQFAVCASDGNNIPFANRILKNTISVSSGETYDIKFVSNNPGVWPFHCHIPHHMSNNFTDPAGGMFTTIVYKS